MLTPAALRASVVGSGGTQFSKQFNKGALVVVKHKLHGKLTGGRPLPKLVQLPSLQLPPLQLPQLVPSAAATSAAAIFATAATSAADGNL